MIVFKYLGNGEWCLGVPARDITRRDIVDCKLDMDFVRSIVKPDGTPLYEEALEEISVPDEAEERGSED